MKILCILTVFFIVLIAQAQIVNIPDANFKNALVTENVVDIDGDGIGDIPVDTNNDGEIQESEAEIVEDLIVSYFDILSIEGIGSFINLLKLKCDNNLLSTIDISLNTSLRGLYCGSNNLNELDVSQNLNLSFLWCDRNELNSLDVSQNTNLINLNCKLNNLSELDVSKHLNLSTLNCSFNNLSELDVSQNLDLTTLYCGGNNLSNIDLSNNTKIFFFTCSGNNFTELDLSYNVNLYWFMCHDTEQLEYLDLRNGGNDGLSLMWVHNTPNLRCILIDNESEANSEECGFPTSGWCKDDNDLYIETMEDCVLATKDNTFFDFIIYPNPIQNILFIEAQEQIEGIKIYSLEGRFITDSTKNRIDVSQLQAGMYFVQVTIEGTQQIKKFIKN